MGQSFDPLQRQVDVCNRSEGNLEGERCELCKNKGSIAVIVDGYILMKECSCIPKRKSIARIERSGLAKQLKKCTFENYNISDQWQQAIKTKAVEYSQSETESWFFIGGQVGAGKSHLCTAICSKLINAGKNLMYMVWSEEVVSLKSLKMNEEEYKKAMWKWTMAEVLYIDDFFKVRNGERPTNADVNIAFEILNYRYNNNLKTIVSSEKTMNDVIDIDEAVGSRIYEKCDGNNMISLKSDKKKNYRMKGMEI